MRVGMGERVLLTFWVGSLWTIGYVVAPTLFQLLEDRALAGMIAGRLFTIESYIGLLCGGLLLLAAMVLAPAGKRLNARVSVLAAMLIVIVIGEFVLRPMMAELKSEGASQSKDFFRLHGVSSVLYLINSLLGLLLVGYDDRLRPKT